MAAPAPPKVSAAADPANPTKAELAALGVEIDANPEPPRAKFREATLKDKPATDRKLTLDSGVKLRERIERVPVEALATGGGTVTEGTFNLVITHALLTEADEVATAPDGSFRIKGGSHRHEIAFDAERMGAMTEPQILAAELQQREVAAHKAALFFDGLDKAERLFGGRVTIPLPIAEEIKS